MLTAKPWRTEALIRLLLGVMPCVFIGWLGMSLLRFPHASVTERKWLLPTAAVGFFSLVGAVVLTRRRWRIENATTHMRGFVVCLSVGLASVWLLQSGTHADSAKASLWQLVIGGLSIQGAALLLIAMFLREHQSSWADGFGFRNSRTRAVMLGLLTAMAFVPVAQLLQLAASSVLMRLHVSADAQGAVEALRAAPTWVERLPLGFVAIVVAPLAEESLFRGLIYPVAKRTGFPRLALWGTAVLLATVHFNLVSFVPLVLLALLLTWLYERTDNLLAPIAAHSVFNTLNFVALQIFGQAWSQPR
jgi:membrane protease YdiL (CAAX protease family)